MQYGYFDLEHKEYVITRPDTPAPWANYLGSPEYGAIVSNNGGGYSFVKSGANGRIIRYRFNSNIGLPGRYIYIRDNDAKDYWSCTWQPVGKPLDQYKTECHHGTAYTTIKSDYADIHSELTYYVPLNKTYEVWRTKITNNSDRYRNLSTFGFVEFTNENNYEQRGLIQPDIKEGTTGNRYYTIDSFTKLRSIRIFQKLNKPLFIKTFSIQI
jgi:cellobiose phosphorylase